MRKICFLFFIGVFFCFKKLAAQNVGIGTSNPHASAKLEIQSGNSGLLIPRLTTSQINSIASPAKGLMTYDSTKKLFSFHNGSQWVDIKPIISDDSNWSSLMANGELNLFNARGQHTYVGGLPMLPTGNSGTIDGVFRIEHGSPFPVTTRYYLTMDGKGIQARSQASFLSPQVDANLLLNQYGGNVGIGLVNPTLAKLVTEGYVGNTMAVFRRDPNSQGISLVGDWPGVYFNSYFNGGTKTMSSTGFAGIINMDQSSGAFTFNLSPTANAGANQSITIPEIMRISKEGSVGIGTTTPSAKLHVTSVDALYSGILATGNSYSTSTYYDGVWHTLYTHRSAITAQSNNNAVALEVNGPVAVTSGNQDFVFNVFCQNSDAAAMGYVSSLGGGYWAINLTGNNSPLNNLSFPSWGYIYVTPFFAWSSYDPGGFNIPSKQMLFYGSNGNPQWVVDVAPIQTAKSIIQLRVMVIRRNPDSD